MNELKYVELTLYSIVIPIRVIKLCLKNTLNYTHKYTLCTGA